MEPILEVRNLTCGYQKMPVFTGLNLALYPRQLSGLVGPSGSGKSTLIKAILGLIRPWGGEIWFRGKRLKSEVAPPKVGYVPQVETVDWTFPVTAEEVVMMGRYRQQKIWPLPSKRDRAVARSFLARVGIEYVADRPIGELSGGQQQRVFLARALVGEPEIVFLDEPTSSSDLQVQHELLHLLADLNQQGLTIFLSTHDLNSVATHLPWVVCFNHGLICQGQPIDVFTPANLEHTFGAQMIVYHQGDRILIASDSTSIRHQMQQNLPKFLS
ncbi:metal ABC transporter ATP-binding protein [Kamptonema animale CS-326]|jgi:zinc/manganese transport system ATP-binding protein|uniref:metal ABC transporter ATP-binding protein n=1 Tax=Kamptonema animale TaxID=92934 RepID=UPI00232BC4E9|nr:metal ABC transporter ATP-binding protein [Kamptonema animale]MDB9511010.1 metal ABC transporter ATP-binding protein [Kamptonema animale CS-326]